MLVPILLYHSISTRPSALIRPFTITPAAFERQLDCVVELGLESVTVSAFADAIRGRGRLPARPVVITFDDGFADFADAALPALCERGLAVTLYVTTGFLRDGGARPSARCFDDRMLDWSQLPELCAAGVEIGAHSHSHPHLDTLGAAAAGHEIRYCRNLLEERLGRAVPSFAYPNGYSSPAVRRLVRETGYTSACGVKNALSSPAEDIFSLARLMVRADTPLDELRGWLTGSRAAVAPAGERVRTRAWRAARRARATVTGRPGSDLQ